MRINRKIRVPRVRLIDQDGVQVGIISTDEALMKAERVGLDLVEVAPTADPPVCKIIDYGKFRYQLTKKEKEGRRSQHQVKLKEIKVKPNTDDHDLNFKVKHAREFIEKGCKVRVTCVFRGREMQHTEVGMKVITGLCGQLSDVATPEAPPKMMGRTLSVVLSPGVKGAKKGVSAENRSSG